MSDNNDDVAVSLAVNSVYESLQLWASPYYGPGSEVFRVYPNYTSLKDFDAEVGDVAVSFPWLPTNSAIFVWNALALNVPLFKQYPGRSPFEKAYYYYRNNASYLGVCVKGSSFPDGGPAQCRRSGVAEVRYTYEARPCVSGMLMLAGPPMQQHRIDRNGEFATRMETMVKPLETSDLVPSTNFARSYFRVDDDSAMRKFEVVEPSPAIPHLSGVLALQRATVLATIAVLKAQYPDALRDVKPMILAGLRAPEDDEEKLVHTLRAEQGVKLGQAGWDGVHVFHAIQALSIMEATPDAPSAFAEYAKCVSDGFKEVFSSCIGISLGVANTGELVKIALFGGKL